MATRNVASALSGAVTARGALGRTRAACEEWPRLHPYEGRQNMYFGDDELDIEDFIVRDVDYPWHEDVHAHLCEACHGLSPCNGPLRWHCDSPTPCSGCNTQLSGYGSVRMPANYALPAIGGPTAGPLRRDMVRYRTHAQACMHHAQACMHVGHYASPAPLLGKAEHE